MDVKRYQRETLPDALRAVREDLGPSALVLSTRLVSAPGLRGWFRSRVVEVTAAAQRPSLSEGRQRGGVSDGRAGEKSAGGGQRTGVAQQVGSQAPREATDRDAHRAIQEIAARLEAAGVDAGLAHQVAQAHPPSTRRGASLKHIRRTLAEQLAALAADDDGYAPVEVFVGPPGVGKTTTIAKIAAQERARQGTRLGLVAADGFRVGAVEQLRLYADILGSPFMVARTPDELATVLEGRRGPVLLDTAGRSPADQVSRDMFRVLAGRPGVRTHLVLPATSSLAAARLTIDCFQEARPSRVVVTRLDEVESLAALVPLLRECRLPISYLGFGQRVPEDLERATAAVLAAWVSGDRVRPEVAA